MQIKVTRGTHSFVEFHPADKGREIPARYETVTLRAGDVYSGPSAGRLLQDYGQRKPDVKIRVIEGRTVKEIVSKQNEAVAVERVDSEKSR